MRQILTLLTILAQFVPMLASSDVDAVQATPVTDRPVATCGREPRTVDELIAIAGVRESAVVISSFEDLPDTLPSGAPVEPATEDEIRAMLDEFVACILSGEQLRSYAYFTDRFLRNAGPIDEGYLSTLAGTPTPEPDQTFYAVDDVSRIERLADGRVGAVVTYGGACERSQPEPTCTFYLLFLEQDGQWFIDDQIRFLTTSDRSEFLTVPEYLARETPQVATPGT